MPETNNIYHRINAIRQNVKYIKKDTVVGNYKAISHDEVISKVRESFVEFGVMVYPSETSGETIVSEWQDGDRRKVSYLYDAKYEVWFVNIDDPGDKFCLVVGAHGLDFGDKAPGKACTYATKMAIVKVLMLETGINDESREEQRMAKETISTDQLEQLNKMLEPLINDENFVLGLLKAHGIKNLGQLLKGSFQMAKAHIMAQAAKNRKKEQAKENA